MRSIGCSHWSPRDDAGRRPADLRIASHRNGGLPGLAPLGVPAAALGLALTLRVDRLRPVMLLACLAGTVSIALTMGPHVIADSAQVPEAVGRVTTLAQWVSGWVEWPLQLASLSALLPILGWLMVRTLRVSPTQVTSLLVSIAVLECLRLWLRLRAIVPADALVPHLVLLTGVVLTAAALRLRRNEHVR